VNISAPLLALFSTKVRRQVLPITIRLSMVETESYDAAHPGGGAGYSMALETARDAA
jgi:hypothetical protein